MGALFTVLAVYPFVERWVTGDDREHHLLQRPRNAPVRTAFGAAGMTFYGICWIAGGNDVLAVVFNLDIYAITWVARIGVFVGPVVAFLVTKRICIALQRKDREELLHGYETGIIERSPAGGYSERHLPLAREHQYTLTTHERDEPIEAPAKVDEHGVENPNARKGRLRASASQFYFADVVNKPTREELEEAHEHHPELPEGEHEEFRGVSETGVPRDH